MRRGPSKGGNRHKGRKQQLPQTCAQGGRGISGGGGTAAVFSKKVFRRHELLLAVSQSSATVNHDEIGAQPRRRRNDAAAAAKGNEQHESVGSGRFHTTHKSLAKRMQSTRLFVPAVQWAHGQL